LHRDMTLKGRVLFMEGTVVSFVSNSSEGRRTELSFGLLAKSSSGCKL
jgi:hypothetical protein